MKAFIVCLLCLAALFFILLCVLWLMAFSVSPFRKKARGGEVHLPEGEAYAPYEGHLQRWVKQMREMNGQEHSITSHDGLRLCARYYEFSPESPVEIMFHGYRGSAERDMSGGIDRSFSCGHSAFIVDQRCSGLSDGCVISFGINESRDCMLWLNYVMKLFPGREIILTGISMGASTVLLASANELPPQVKGILADCGYSSAKEELYHVIRSMKLPPKVFYPLVRLAGRLFGGFDVDKCRPVDAVKSCRVPVIFLHGEADDFVPPYMSRENFEACASRKALVLIPGAGHGVGFPADPELYLSSVREFFGCK